MRHLSLLRAGYALALALILYLALAPNPPAEGFESDKLNHMAAFFALAFAAKVLWPGLSALRLALMLVLLGGAIEVLQATMGLGRDGDWLDFIADVFAIFVGVGLGSLAGRILSRRR